MSLRHPASWRNDQAEQDGVWYRYFLAPPTAPQGRAPVSVTLLAGPMAVPVDQYAQTYLAGHTVASTRPEERQGVPGQSWVFSSADGKTRYRLLLLAQGGRVLGLYAQGEAAAADKQAAVLDEMWSSLTVERPDRYPVTAWKDQHASLGVPESWRETRRFSGGGTLVTSYVSPALAVDKGRADRPRVAVRHLRAGSGGRGPRGVLRGDAPPARRQLQGHEPLRLPGRLRGRHADRDPGRRLLREAVLLRRRGAGAARSASRRREDVFPRASRWADYIASTLAFGGAGDAAK